MNRQQVEAGEVESVLSSKILEPLNYIDVTSLKSLTYKLDTKQLWQTSK